MLKSAIVAIVLGAVAVGNAKDQSPVRPFETDAEPTPQGKIDQLVFARLKQLSIRPARVCADEVFVRRAYLDIIGTLPTAEEAKSFLEDQAPDKRQVLIDRLLAREEFADYWAVKWSDLLRVKAEFPINLWPNAVQAYHRWIRTSTAQNMPYDRFVRELLTANGSNFRVPQVNFYRAVQTREPQAIAQAVALTFMGARAENWPPERLAGMAAFFSRLEYKTSAEWKEEIVFFNPHGARAAADGVSAAFPDGTPAKLPPDRDPRAVFADRLVDARNPWFARNIVNRVWSWLLGRGIIHEPDDIRPDNPPSNPDLLAFLEQELVRAHYDLKPIYRLILNSTAYHLSSIPARVQKGDSPLAKGDCPLFEPASENPEAEANFAHYPLRRLEAEVLIDAIDQITGTTEKYSSAIPEPFTFIPEKQRSIALADASVTSSFLGMFGRSSRDTGLESERNNRPSGAQWLHLLNSSHIRRKIEDGPKLQALAQSRKGAADIARELYMMILSRTPTADELKIIVAHDTSSRAKTRDLVVDLTWALLNSDEFLYRH